MLVRGSKQQQKALGEGQFFCPHCNKETWYELKPVSRSLTLYFLPLFERKNLRQFVECQFCQNAFDPEILHPESQKFFKILAAAKFLLHHGKKPLEVRSKFLALGLTEELVNKLIAMAQTTQAYSKVKPGWSQGASARF